MTVVVPNQNPSSVVVRPGQRIRPAGDPNLRGRIGALLQRNGKNYALTVLHVLKKINSPVSVAPSIPVELIFAGQFIPIGKVVEGSFDATHDIAIVELDANITPSNALGDQSICLRDPPPSFPLLLNVFMIMPGEATFTFECERISDPITVLGQAITPARFTKVDGPAIEQGFSGSVLFLPNSHRIVALLTAASSDDQIGYGHFLGSQLGAYTVLPC